MQTYRRELLDRTLIWNRRHLLHALREFETFCNTTSNNSGNLASRSRINNRARQPASSRSMTRFRAAWITHAAVGWPVAPRTRMRRVWVLDDRQHLHVGAGESHGLQEVTRQPSDRGRRDSSSDREGYLERQALLGLVADAGEDLIERDEILPYCSAGHLRQPATMRSSRSGTRVYGGQRFDTDEWTTEVFVLRDGRWLCVLSHITAAASA
ncbi:hypothetical protein [Actinomadura geliboluensis]|uniref:hypothetical protein n=1 Tax=Actinomadura geliboluensis TaxID=882440 RepID=UPI003718AF8E